MKDDQSLLKKQYDKITCVSPGSVLAKYLSPAALNPSKQQDHMPIFHFGFNLSQKYEIPILRLRTNESGEEAKLQNKLNQILKPAAG